MIQKPKGTKDILPDEIEKWQFIEAVAIDVFENYGFKEMRVPTFEHTELFERGVGDTTDVVQKEMYTFKDKGGRSITLRPEGTAGIIRAFIENGISSKPSPFKIRYIMPMFRYENVQKGRYREFNQIGAEIIGSNSYLADLELISMADIYLKKIGIENVELNINSIGCPKCRKNYQDDLKKFIGNNLEYYCDTCKTRFEKNPMRILDCKEKKCKELNQGAPIILDYLCEDCRNHFENLKSSLKKLNIEYKIDSSIVRGLDYYTKTVFEFVSNKDELTVLGGGRYDGLVNEFGGGNVPAVGFAAGEERLVSLVSDDKVFKNTLDLYIATMNEKYNIKAIEIANSLRKDLSVQTDISCRSLNAQLKYANKIGASYLIVIGEDELNKNICKVKDMKTGMEYECGLNVNEIEETIFSTEEEV